MLSNYKAEIFLKSYYMNDPPPLANEHHVPVHVLYVCIFLVYSSSIHYSVDFNRNGLSLLYIFFKTFTMYIYMYQCVCAYKIQMHNISEIKWYKAV